MDAFEWKKRFNLNISEGFMLRNDLIWESERWKYKENELTKFMVDVVTKWSKYKWDDIEENHETINLYFQREREIMCKY